MIQGDKFNVTGVVWKKINKTQESVETVLGVCKFCEKFFSVDERGEASKILHGVGNIILKHECGAEEKFLVDDLRKM